MVRIYAVQGEQISSGIELEHTHIDNEHTFVELIKVEYHNGGCGVGAFEQVECRQTVGMVSIPAQASVDNLIPAMMSTAILIRMKYLLHDGME